MVRKSTLRRVRKGKRRGRESGFIVTWDVNSVDKIAARRLYYFLFGATVSRDGHLYRYPGFLEKDGIRYLGQSVVFVTPARVSELRSFLAHEGIEHEDTVATLGGF